MMNPSGPPVADSQSVEEGIPASALPRREFHIPSLDGIRALAFLLVFVAHAGLDHIVPGGFGVTTFFFLSGYLITTLLRVEQQNTGKVRLGDFYLRRVLRIWPPFYTILVLALLLRLLGLLPGELQANAVIAQWAHMTNYWSILHGFAGIPAGTGVYWSLAVEEHFYLVFPCLFIFLQRLFPGEWRRQAPFLLCICLAVLAWRVALVARFDASADRTFLASDTRIDSILFGCALAVGANPMLDKPRRSAEMWRHVLLPLGVGVLLFTFVFRAPWFRETLRYTLQGIALVPPFVVGMREPSWGPFRWLNLAPVRHVGVLSYSLYLSHQVVLYLLEAQLPRLQAIPRGVLALACSLAIAEGMHRLIEKPCARLRRKLAHATWSNAGPAPSR